MTDTPILGRSVVVGPGDSAPAAWSECERRAVTSVDAEMAGELHAAWRERRPMVLELQPGLGLDDPVLPPPEVVAGRQPWEWPVDLELVAERLHHGLWANSVDAREPGRPRWRWAEEAVGAGASPADGPASEAGADVILPDGRPAVCDGGPLDAGTPGRVGWPVLHRMSIEHRLLQPLDEDRITRAAEQLEGRLAADQLRAVREGLAGARVIAPAGSGKTRVLTERARMLITGWGLPAAALALVAFNVRAAGEMRDRLGDVPSLRIRTLNALGLRLCGRSTTIEERDVRSLLSTLVAFPRRAETDPAAPWIEALGRIRLGLMRPDLVEEELGDVSDLARVARSYRALLAERASVDFDEQITGAIERLLTDPQFRVRSQRFARVLLVDEFQDLTPAHLLLLRLLSGPAGSVFGVGDDDQTIYGYAGATPRWLVDFADWFPGSASHPLEVNYRCPAPVVEAASNLLTRNAVRVPKTIRAARAGAGQANGGGRTTGGGPTTGGPDVTALSVLDTAGDRPSTRTADRVAELIVAGVAPADVAVLSRVNASLVPVQVLLGHRGVPVDTAGDRRFLQRGGVRGALAWLEVASAPEDRIPGPALRDAARRPKRGMSNGLLDLLGRPRSVESLDGLALWLEEKGSARDAEKIDGLARDVALVRRAAPGGTARVLGVVRRQIGAGGLDATAGALDQWAHGAIAAHLDDLDALTELAELEPDPARFPSWLADRLSAGRDHDGVTLASIHAVKGREWPHVVLHHVTAGLIPHRLSADSEEERRIFHVGLTRAIRSLSVVPGSPPSPFIAEMDRPGEPDRAGAAATARAEDRSTRSGRGRSGAGDRAGSGRQATARAGGRAGPDEFLPVTPGLVFTAGGHDHEVVEIGPDGAVCLLAGGPARTSVRFGAEVTRSGKVAVLAHPGAQTAWEQLRAWRAERARTLSVPAFVIFDDATLRSVAAHLPLDETGLLALRGIGPAKLEAHGGDLIAICERVRSQL